MLKNVLNRMMSAVLAMTVIFFISLSDVQAIYETFANENTADTFITTKTEDDIIYLEDTSSNVSDSENNFAYFEYGDEDFSVKAKMDNKAVFSLENEQLTADDVRLSVTEIDENDERFERLHMSAYDDEHCLFLYDIGFYTENGKKADVSDFDAQFTFYYNNPYAVCENDNLSVVKFTEIPAENDEDSGNYFDCSETEIIGSTYVNDELTDITFHADSLTVYGILLPVTEFETNDYDSEENPDILINEEAGLNLIKEENTNENNSSQNTEITINTFKLELKNGAEEKILNGSEDKGYVWTADKPDEGHGFTYGLDFNTSGGTFNSGEIEIRIPKHILKDKDGNYADQIYLPYPEENEEYDNDKVEFVYREEKNSDGTEQILIYNVKQLPAGHSINIPFMYETTEKTWEYKDMEKSDDCQATLTIKKDNKNLTAETAQIPVYIDTGVQIKSTSKSLKETRLEWSDSWGIDKPSDADVYIYFIWKVDSSITNITQKYNFQLTDTFNGLISPAEKGNGSPEVIGYRMQGSSKYEVPVNGDSPLVENLTAGSRTDYVLTKCLKSAFNEYGTYELSNNVTATVTPADGKDVHTYKKAAAIGTYERIEPPEPVYTPPAESYKISKYGIYGNRQHVKNKNNISSYDLERLQKGNALAGLTYHINANANAYIKTLEDGITGTEQDAIDGKFGKKNVTYSLSDSEIYLNDSENPLSQDDYTFTSLEYSIKIQDATYNSESKSFISNNVTYKSNDSLEFYILTDDTSEYKLVATYNLSTDKADIKDYNYISSLTDSSVNFEGNVKDWKIQTSNPYYSVNFDVYPTITLKPTNTVKAAIPTTDNAKISVKNSSTLTVDSISRSASGTDYVAKVQRNSNISKKVTSAKNYPGIRGYKINWETSMSETYTDESGTLPVRQESGVFYDLIPVGCRADLNSIKVYADGQQLLESEYTIEELQENYKGSNRTLITVRINTPAESNYKMTYTTVHLWEDILDYGRYVLNSVAYETGNPDIAGGYPDNGGNISDSTVLSDLDPNTNDKRFLYSQATHYINALIPLSSGISKKVASADDSSFGVKTIVHPDSTYVYRIRMENASHSTSKNIVIFDSLENFCNKNNGETADKNCDWHGTLESFGLANLEKLGIKPTIYLSRTKNLDLSNLYTANDAGSIDFDKKDENGNNIWIKQEEFGDISEATAFAIDLSQGIDGKQFELGENRSFSFTVTMRSPKTINSDEISPETYNNIYRSFISTDTENQTETNYYDHQDYTTVIYRTLGDLRFKKINSETNNPIQGIKFNLSGTSFYGTEVNKDIVSDSNGIVYLADLERGTYLLTETDPTADYLKGNDRIVKVDKNGNVTDQNNSDISVIKNTPRVHGDLSFLKMDKLKQKMPVSGAVFTLTGTSDYGNKVEKTASSDNSGVVFFEDVEKGTYTLTETSSPSGYTKLKDSYTVVCDSNGILSITGLSLNANGDYVIYNMPRQEFRLIKLDSATESKYLQGAVFHLESQQTESGEQIIKDAKSGANGFAVFDGLDLGTYKLTETTAPEGYNRDEKEYTVSIALNEETVSVTITDSEGNQLGEITVGDDKGFKFTNEPIPEIITIVKKWEGDTEADRPQSLTIHLSTEKPKMVVYKAMIADTNALKTAFQTQMSSATKLLPASKDTSHNYTLQDLEKMKNITAWQIGVADGTEDKQKDVYIYQDSTKPTIYYYWSEAQTIYLPTNCSQLFSEKSSLTEIDLSELNSSKVTNMRSMFYKCSGLKSLDLSNFNTSNVGSDDSQHNQSMYQMFYGCSGLTSLDLSSFDTSNVTTMQKMFEGCSGLTSLNISSFNTSNVTDMYRMFYNCSGLTSLDLSKFNTSNVTTMQEMFSKCFGLTSLNLSNFNTSNVNNMYNMFYNCSSLTSLNLSSFNTTNVTNMNQMFYSCSSLTSLDLSSFDTHNVTNMSSMFQNCSSLTSLDLSSFDTHNVTNMSIMFHKCSSLTSLDLSSFNTHNVTNMSNMFNLGSNNYILKTIYVSNLWSTQNVEIKNSEKMFAYCFALEGGNGTRYDKARVQNHTYARIDTADTPGYFTDVQYKPTITSTTSSSATEAQVTSLFNSVSNTAKASYNEVANATFQMIPYVNTVKDEPATGNTGNTSGTIEYDTATLHIEPTKTGSTWTYEIPVHDADVLYYVWEETVPEGYTSDATQNEPKEIPEATRQQTITNTKKPVDKGNLKLSKKVTKDGNPVTDDTTPFTFKITLSGDKITENQYFDVYEFIYDENSRKATAEVTLKHDESVTIEGIPTGTKYEITEMETYGYTYTPPTNATGTITKDTTATVNWENKADNRDTGAFHVSKTVEIYEVTEKLDGTKTNPELKNLTDKETNQEFTFTAVLTNLGRSKEYTIKKSGETPETFTSDTSGNATVTFSLKHCEKADFEDIPIGATYQITETAVDGYSSAYALSDANSKNSIVSTGGESETGLETLDINENVTVAFTNSKTVTVKETIETMDIEVKKEWVGDNESYRPKSITIYLERYLDGFPNNVETFDTAIITPHSEWKTKFTNIPKTDEQGRKYIYSVREESVAGYTCSIANPDTDTTTGNQKFTITNTKIPTYDLTINKTVEGAFGNKAKQFEFTVTLTDNSGKPLNGFYTLKRGDTETLILFDVYGQTKIGVSHGEEAVIKNLPQGTKFTVTETDYSKEGYTTDSRLSSNKTEKSLTVNGTLDSNTTVYFINSRNGILPTGANFNVIPFALLGAFSLGMIWLIQRKKYKNFN